MSILFRVSVAHFVSHLHIMTLPSMLLLLPAYFGADFFQLGLAISLYHTATLVTQAPVGWAVDRIGGRKVLAGGLVLAAVSFGALAWLTSFPALIVAMLLAGAANSAYHPADYALLSAEANPAKMGRAFSIHTFAGAAGGAAAPVLLFGAAALWSVSVAFLISGASALLALVLLWWPSTGSRAGAGVGGAGRGTASKPSQSGQAARVTTARIPVLTAAVVALTVLFALLNLVQIPFQTYAVPFFTEFRNIDPAIATTALTVYMAGNAIGVLLGGGLADRTTRHGLLAAGAFAVNAVVVVVLILVPLGPVLLTAEMAVIGLLTGIIAPSRDMLVRAHARPGTEGRVFGLVSVGFSVGSAFGPSGFGWLFDHGYPVVLFLIAAVLMVFTTALSLMLDRSATPDYRSEPVQEAPLASGLR